MIQEIVRKCIKILFFSDKISEISLHLKIKKTLKFQHFFNSDYPASSANPAILVDHRREQERRSELERRDRERNQRRDNERDNNRHATEKREREKRENEVKEKKERERIQRDRDQKEREEREREVAKRRADDKKRDVERNSRGDRSSRDVRGRDGGRDGGRDSGRDGSRGGGRDTSRDNGRASFADKPIDLTRNSGSRDPDPAGRRGNPREARETRYSDYSSAPARKYLIRCGFIYVDFNVTKIT